MRVFVAGATGAIGRQLVPRLVAAGHEVHGMTRSEQKKAMLEDLGGVPVVADALEPEQVAEAVAMIRPEIIVHELTAIEGMDPAISTVTSRRRAVCGRRGLTTSSRPHRRWVSGDSSPRATSLPTPAPTDP